MFTNFGRFILIFNKTALIFLGVRTVFTVSSFNKSDCLDFIANDKWPQFIQPQSTGLGLEAVLESSKAATEAKTSSRVLKCTLVNLVWLNGESHWQRCERLPRETAGMCVSQRWTFWTFNVL